MNKRANLYFAALLGANVTTEHCYCIGSSEQFGYC